MTVAQPSSSTRSPRLHRPALPHTVPIPSLSSPQPPVVARPSAPLNSRPLILLRTLCRREKSQLLCNHSNPNSFAKIPGVGAPLRELARCTEAQKCLSVSPLLATLTHSVACESFPCHSCENTRDGGASAPPRHPSLRRHMRHVAPLFPVPSLDCAYFLSPRGCTASPSTGAQASLLKRGPRYSFPCAGRKTSRRSAPRRHQPQTRPSLRPAAARVRSAPNGIRQ